jgi:ketosteroid isomerase-like protein
MDPKKLHDMRRQEGPMRIVLLLTVTLAFGCSSPGDKFARARQSLLEASQEFAHGNPGPWKELCSHREDVALFGASGGYERGWSAIDPRYSWASASFAGGSVSAQNLAMLVSGNLAYTVELERWDVRFAQSGQEASVLLRVTHIFRLEDGAWKLIHRHADNLTTKQDVPSIAKPQ